MIVLIHHSSFIISPCLLLFRRFRQFEGRLPNRLDYRAAAETLRANAHRFSRAVGCADMHVLQVRAELAARDAGHFSTHPAEVFRLTAMRHRIAHDGLLSTHFT